MYMCVCAVRHLSDDPHQGLCSLLSVLRTCDSSSVYQSLSLSIPVIKSPNLFLKVLTQTWAVCLNFSSISFFLSPGQASGVLGLSNVWNKMAVVDAGEV